MLNTSKVVIGTWPLSGDFGRINKKEVYKTLEHCLKVGFKEFDTAPNYGGGAMESIIGEVFEGIDDISINTKCGNHLNNKKDFSATALKSSLYRSLDRLRINSIKTLFLHNPRDEIKSLLELKDFFKHEKVNGRIKYSGLSLAKDFHYSSNEVNYFDALQNDLNLLYLKPFLESQAKTKVYYARSPLATGLLSGRITKDTTFPKDDFRSTWLKGERLESLVKRVKRLDSITNIPISSLARRFLLQQKFPNKVIFGVKNHHHVNDILNDLKTEPLKNTIVQEIIMLYKQDFGLPKNQKSLGY